MKVYPLSNQVLIRRQDPETKTRGGIFIPTNAQGKPEEGTVLAMGRGKITSLGKLIEPSVRAGDRVIFEKYADKEVEIDGEKLLMLNEDDILAVFDK